MATYTYRIETLFDTGRWAVEKDEARGTEVYDGTAEELAMEVLRNRVDDLIADGEYGYYRVLVWAGTTEGWAPGSCVVAPDAVGSDVDGWAQRWVSPRAAGVA